MEYEKFKPGYNEKEITRSAKYTMETITVMQKNLTILYFELNLCKKETSL